MPIKPVPKPSILDKQVPLGYVNGEKRWRSTDRQRIYTWDSLHGEIEAFTRRGRHIGACDPQTGMFIKDAVKGRRIDV